LNKLAITKTAKLSGTGWARCTILTHNYREGKTMKLLLSSLATAAAIGIVMYCSAQLVLTVDRVVSQSPQRVALSEK